jgi:hypothetical protein
MANHDCYKCGNTQSFINGHDGAIACRNKLCIEARKLKAEVAALTASLAELRKRSDEMFKYIMALRHALVDHTCADGRSESGEVNWGELLLRYGANSSELASPPSPAPAAPMRDEGKKFDENGCRHMDGICAKIGFPGHVKPEDF